MNYKESLEMQMLFLKQDIAKHVEKVATYLSEENSDKEYDSLSKASMIIEDAKNLAKLENEYLALVKVIQRAS